MSKYHLYIGCMTYRKEDFGNCYPVLSQSKPTPEQVAEIWEIEGYAESDPERYLEVFGPVEPKMMQ